jgi:4-amino-4-deoxy-L-arabinose transferase-like glycosyltransferase
LSDTRSARWPIGLTVIAAVYLHNTLPHLTMMPRVNVDEPWLMERAYQVWTTGVPSQPMLGLKTAYLLQVGYGYLLAPWLGLFGFGLFQARLFGVLLGLGIIVMTATLGRRLLDPISGLAAALFLAADSNFLGGVRNTRTDIPSVFFAVVALITYVTGRQSSKPGWFFASGAALGLAVLCHGNAFWAGLILVAWFLLDYGRRALRVPFGYWMTAGVAATFGPYLLVVLIRWKDVQLQIANFAGDRVPGWQLGFIARQVLREIDRYRAWYFGLVTNDVPNPLLWAFQAAVVLGMLALAIRVRREGAARVLILAAGTALIFAAFINNKVPVYLPHVLIGFSLAAGFAVSESARLLPLRAAAAAALIALTAYGAASVVYYEKWYASVRKTELVPYEVTADTLRTLVPDGAKYLYASPQFWVPFHDASATAFYSYAAAQPIASPAGVTLAGAADDRPIYLLVDEMQWLPELTMGVSQPGTDWQRAWVRFIEEQCGVDAMALGTAHGTIALYRCQLQGIAPARSTPRIVAGRDEYEIGEPVLRQTAADLARWTRYADPRRTAASPPARVELTDRGLLIAGRGWPGISHEFAGEIGAAYLVRAQTQATRDGDLLYLGTWREPQIQSLVGSSSSGLPAALVPQPWFPHDRAFVATGPRVQMLVYSEAPRTAFEITALDVYRLHRRAGAAPR